MVLPISQILLGNPVSDSHQPSARELAEYLQTLFLNLTGANAGALIQTSKAALDGLSPAANTMAWVIGDANPDLDGVYQRSGSTWVKRGPLPYSVIQLNNADEGTANAIEVTTAVGIPSAAFGALYILNVTQENTGAVTVSINGAAAKPLISNTGAPLLAGAITAGMGLLCVDDGTSIRLLVPGDIDAIIAEAEALLAAAEAIAGNAYTFNTEADFVAANIPASVQSVRTVGHYEPGDGGGHVKVRLEVAPDPVEAWHKQSADGAWWQIAEKIINPYMFGAVGDGVADDYPQWQGMLDAAPALTARVHVLDGAFRQATGPPLVHSGTVITGNGKDRSILIQPNHYSYNRGVDPYVAADVVDWNALYMDVGTTDVDISGLDLRGPFWQPDEAGYTANPVENWPASNGISVRGHDYEVRQGLPLSDTPSRNIRIEHNYLEGWGEDAIQLDQVTDAWVDRNIMTRVGRGGVRTYGAVNAWIQFNDISYGFPGDYLNNGNRMYGVTATRRYAGALEDDRPSENVWIVGNTVHHFPLWKGLDTHGGRKVYFLYNKVSECHIAIGIDKGGFTEIQGIAPPYEIFIEGNYCFRSLPDDPDEGDVGVIGPGIFIVSHDQTDAQIGRNVTIKNNILEGWGEDTRFGSLTFSNFLGVTESGNRFIDTRRTAICVRERFDGNISNEYIDDVRRTGAGVQRGIAVESDDCRGLIGPCQFINRQTTDLEAIFLSNPAVNQGFTVSADHQFRSESTGLITRVNIGLNDQLGSLSLLPSGMAYVAVGGDDSVTLTGTRGVTSVVRESEGTFLVTIERAASAANNVIVAPQIVGSNRAVQWSRVSTTQFRIVTYNLGGTATDNSFSFMFWAI